MLSIHLSIFYYIDPSIYWPMHASPMCPVQNKPCPSVKSKRIQSTLYHFCVHLHFGNQWYFIDNSIDLPLTVMHDLNHPLRTKLMYSPLSSILRQSLGKVCDGYQVQYLSFQSNPLKWVHRKWSMWMFYSNLYRQIVEISTILHHPSIPYWWDQIHQTNASGLSLLDLRILNL